jgi:uncharacterized membrane protein
VILAGRPNPKNIVMNQFYNMVAGKSLERLAALSDGVFAIAMTLLVLDLHVPQFAKTPTEGELLAALLALAPSLIPYGLTFLTLGIFWVAQQTQLNSCTRSDRTLAWITMAFLLIVTLTPFTTALLAKFITYRTALLFYWLNILALGITVLWMWLHAQRAGLIKEEVPAEMRKALERRIVIAQCLYAAGAALCIFNTYWSIGFILLVQINYAIAPRLGPLYRI